MDNEIAVKRQLMKSITPMIPSSVRTLVTMPNKADVTKS